MMKKYLSKEVLTILLCLGIISCRSTSDTVEASSGNATIKIALNGSNFDDTGILGNQASITKNINTTITEQRQEISLEGNNDYKLVATLTPINSTNSITPQATSKINPIAGTETNPLAIGIKYKVVVYDTNGNYVKEQDYTSGQNTPNITGLDGGSTYTFVVYSIGSSTDLPSVTYSDSSNKTLSTASLNNVSGDSDLMYYSTSMPVTGNNINYLNITLTHKYSQIITTLDASLTGTYRITQINGVTISPQSGTSNMQLSNGNTTATGTSGTRAISFPTLGSATVTSSPVLINSDNVTSGSFFINSITMDTGGGLNATITHQNVTFNSLKITRGIKYSLKLSFTPNDKNFTYRGYPAVRINGFVWMRHNLGADISKDPDTPSQALIGNYYQWGRNNIVANASTSENAITSWSTSPIPANNSWNTSDESTPVKTTTDPCPSGWRVPTGREYINLFSNTTNTKIGDNTAYPTNYSAASVLTSQRNSAVKLTFQSTGFRRSSDGTLVGRGSAYTYWNNVSEGSTNAYSAKIPAFDIYNRNSGQPIRCIADSPLDNL
ncbi:hypothetical protein BEI02_10465 [Elizabethkingia sp. HvH-WGS333]|nr:hypothetical protein AMC91_03575 [Elizabethkingia miricola]OIK47702.1 hypothetical protein BEI02_10465 [Elizabethkingia sp. HvH-WGS333]